MNLCQLMRTVVRVLGVFTEIGFLMFVCTFLLKSGNNFEILCYHPTSNLIDVSNHSDNFANNFLNSNCTVHSKLLEWLVL